MNNLKMTLCEKDDRTLNQKSRYFITIKQVDYL